MWIYKITNLINEKIYVGKTVKTLKKRFQQHITDARSTTKDYVILRAIRKYGESNFIIEPLENVLDENKLFEREEYWTLKLHSNDGNIGYNIKVGDQWQYNTCRLEGRGPKYKYNSVFKIGKSYRMSINYRDKIYNKHFSSEDEAAKCRDMLAIYFWGRDIKLNFPSEAYSDEDIINNYNFVINKNKTSKYLGVGLDKRSGKWDASVKYKYNYIHLGRYVDEAVAAETFDKINLFLRGKAAKLNFPEKLSYYLSLDLENFYVTKTTRRKTSSRYKGLTWHRNRWEVRIIKDKKTIHIGSFKNEKEAAKMYNDKAKELFGEKAELNIIL